MKKSLFFLLLFFACSFKSYTQTFTASLDSLVATFAIKNKKAVQVQPNTGMAKAFSQKHTADLLYLLDAFFTSGEYRTAKTIKASEYLVTAKLSEKGNAIDSFLSVVYLLDLPGAGTYSKRLKTGTFLPVKSRPTKVPEQCYISLLADQRVVLVTIVAPMYRDETAAALRKDRVKRYLDWIMEKYQ